MLLDTVCEAEPNAEYDTKDSIRRSLMSEFNECISNVSLHTIMNETEYNLFKLLIVGFAINYMLWYTFAFVKIMNTTTEE
jgi:hypothetical protein